VRPVASLRDLVYAWITEQIDQGVDFTDKQARIESREKFLLAHPGQKKPTVEAAWSKVLTRVAKERGLAITQVKHPKRAPKEYDTAELQAEVSSEPVEVEAGQITLKQAGKGDQGRGGDRGKGEQEQGRRPGGDQGAGREYRRYTSKAIGAFFNGLYMGIRAVIPECEPLTEAEIETLGDLWEEHFNIILAERPNLSIVMALGGTIGLLGGKVIEGRRRQAKAQEQEDILNRTKGKARQASPAEQQRAREQTEQELKKNKKASTTYDADDMESGAEAHPRGRPSHDGAKPPAAAGEGGQ